MPIKHRAADAGRGPVQVGLQRGAVRRVQFEHFLHLGVGAHCKGPADMKPSWVKTARMADRMRSGAA